MKISWLGHSAFRLEESTGTVVVTDPYHSLCCDMPIQSADVVTISHSQKDNKNIEIVTGNPEIISDVGFYEIDGVNIQALKTEHKTNSNQSDNLVCKYRMDGVDICHMGDVTIECTPLIVDSLMPVNILLIPVGGTNTIDAEQAFEYVDKLMPDIVIPMHYKTKDCEFDISKVSDFLNMFDDEDVIHIHQNTVEFDRADFDGDKTKILVLEKFS